MSESSEMNIDDPLFEEKVDNEKLFENSLKIDNIIATQPKISVDTSNTDAIPPSEVLSAMTKASETTSTVADGSTSILEVIKEIPDENNPSTVENATNVESPTQLEQVPPEPRETTSDPIIPKEEDEPVNEEPTSNPDIQVSGFKQVLKIHRNQYAPIGFQDLLNANQIQTPNTSDSPQIPPANPNVIHNSPILDKIFQVVTKIDERSWQTYATLQDMNKKMQDSIETISLCIDDISTTVDEINKKVTIPEGLGGVIEETQAIIMSSLKSQVDNQKTTLEEIMLCKNQLADLKIVLGSLESNMQQRAATQNLVSIATPTIAGASYMEAKSPPEISTTATVATQGGTSRTASVAEASPKAMYNESKIIGRFGTPADPYTGCEAFHEWIVNEGKIHIKEYFPTMDAVDVIAAKRAIAKSKEYAVKIFGFNKKE